MFKTIDEVMAACELAGYQPRSHITGLNEQTYWVHLPSLERGICFWGDTQFICWANAHWHLLEIYKIREQAGWELLDACSADGEEGWYSPCGIHESEWRSSGNFMPEELPSGVARLSQWQPDLCFDPLAL